MKYIGRVPKSIFRTSINIFGIKQFLSLDLDLVPSTNSTSYLKNALVWSSLVPKIISGHHLLFRLPDKIANGDATVAQGSQESFRPVLNKKPLTKVFFHHLTFLSYDLTFHHSLSHTGSIIDSIRNKYFFPFKEIRKKSEASSDTSPLFNFESSISLSLKKMAVKKDGLNELAFCYPKLQTYALNNDYIFN